MSTLNNIRLRITRITNWKLKATLLALLCLTTFLAFVDVRATTAPPLTSGYDFSTCCGVTPRICSPSNGTDVQVASVKLIVPANATGLYLPPTFTGNFNVSSSTNPSYTVEWYGNGTLWGSTTGYAQPSGKLTSTTYGTQFSSVVGWDWFGTAHSGPLTEYYTINIQTASGQIVCVQNWYVNTILIYS
jgi:hypothetical protein